MSQIAHAESAVLVPEVSESVGLPLRHIVAEAVAHAEAVAIRLALRAAGGDVVEAARSLSTTPGTLRVKMQRYRISPVGVEREVTAPI